MANMNDLRTFYPEIMLIIVHRDVWIAQPLFKPQELKQVKLRDNRLLTKVLSCVRLSVERRIL